MSFEYKLKKDKKKFLSKTEALKFEYKLKKNYHLRKIIKENYLMMLN